MQMKETVPEKVGMVQITKQQPPEEALEKMPLNYPAYYIEKRVNKIRCPICGNGYTLNAKIEGFEGTHTIPCIVCNGTGYLDIVEYYAEGPHPIWKINLSYTNRKEELVPEVRYFIKNKVFSRWQLYHSKIMCNIQVRADNKKEEELRNDREETIRKFITNRKESH
jgi:hypothetical protein